MNKQSQPTYSPLTWRLKESEAKTFTSICNVIWKLLVAFALLVFIVERADDVMVLVWAGTILLLAVMWAHVLWLWLLSRQNNLKRNTHSETASYAE